MIGECVPLVQEGRGCLAQAYEVPGGGACYSQQENPTGATGWAGVRPGLHAFCEAWALLQLHIGDYKDRKVIRCDHVGGSVVEVQLRSNEPALSAGDVE